MIVYFEKVKKWVYDLPFNFISAVSKALFIYFLFVRLLIYLFIYLFIYVFS